VRQSKRVDGAGYVPVSTGCGPHISMFARVLPARRFWSSKRRDIGFRGSWMVSWHVTDRATYVLFYFGPTRGIQHVMLVHTTKFQVTTLLRHREICAPVSPFSRLGSRSPWAFPAPIKRHKPPMKKHTRFKRHTDFFGGARAPCSCIFEDLSEC